MNKTVSWSMAAMLAAVSPSLLALGLGGASVESYLGQSLDVRVDVIGDNSEELQSITAGLASADDFELLGLSRSAITVPLYFEVITSQARPYIHITSELEVNEPVVQVLLEVVWSNGRMLREYTLFLDPPTVESAAPPVRVDPVRPEPRREVPVPDQQVEPAAAEPAPAPPETVQPEVVEPVSPEPSPQQQAADDVTAEEPVAQRFSGEEVYGPVANGETLWGIAKKYSEGSGYSVNQTMLALQRKNPNAFMHGNINSLMRGAILRMPSLAEMGELTSREALMEAVRQEEELLLANQLSDTGVSTPTVADSGGYQETVAEPEPLPVPEEDSGHLEIVPPEPEVQEDLAMEQPSVPATSSEAIKEELSRTEEELLNARQENAYLNQRIQELEAQVSASTAAAVPVEDSELASIESELAAQRQSEQPEPPVAVTPGGEEISWFSARSASIGGLAVLLIALVVWILRRRSAVGDEVGEPEELQEGITAEQAPEPADEEVDSQPVVHLVPETEPETVVEDEAEPEPEPEPEPRPESDWETVSGQDPVADTEPAPVEDLEPFPVEAEGDDVGDLEIDDPETKLDLARAYLSLGDKEASKSMLEEVISSGNEEQVAEALQMMEEI